jgi:hypothetical protein
LINNSGKRVLEGDKTGFLMGRIIFFKKIMPLEALVFLVKF